MPAFPRSRERLWRRIHALRQALPLYSDETGRIPGAYRAALIDRIALTRRTEELARLLARFAAHFDHPDAVADLAAALRGRSLDGLPDAPDLRALRQRIAAVRPDISAPAPVSRLALDDTGEPVPAPAGDLPRDPVLVIGQEADLDALDFAPLHAARTLRLAPLDFHLDPAWLDRLHARLAGKTQIARLPALDARMDAYSEASDRVSAICDRLARRTLASLLRALPDLGPDLALSRDLREALSLKLSDDLHPRLRQVAATANLAVELSCETPPPDWVTADPALAPLLSRSGAAWILGRARTDSLRLSAPEIALAPADIAAIAEGLRTPAPALRRLVAALRPDQSGSGLLIATLTHHPGYAPVVSALRERLDMPSTLLDLSPPPGAAQLLRSPGPNLRLALSRAGADARTRRAASHLALALEPALASALERETLGDWPATLAFPALRPVLHRLAPQLVGLVQFHMALEEMFAEHPPASLLVAPGRTAGARATVAAARACTVPTLDLQTLFVSRMARYRPPTADRLLVIDRPSAALYREHFNTGEAPISIVGSWQADREVAAIRATTPEDARRRLGLPPERPLVTYGLQTFGESEWWPWIDALARHVAALGDAALCIKLHPGHDASLIGRIETSLAAHPGLVSRVLHTEPISEILAATFVLVTHFSNIGVGAAAAGLPVISLPAPGGVAGVDLVAIGAARAAPTEDALAMRLAEALAGEGASAYRERNPEMGDGHALERIVAAIRAAGEGGPA